MEACGVCLRGGSRAGKSSLALELVARGHRLIADDLIDWRRADGRVIGSCPPQCAGFIEVCGLGVLNVSRLYGAAAVAREAPLDLVIELAAAPDCEDAAQLLQGGRGICTVLGLPVARIVLPAPPGRNLAVLVEAACRDHGLRRSGYRADEDLIQRQLQLLEPVPPA